MNMIFLVDGDNNIGTGLQGIDLLTADDTVLVFYGKGQSLSSVQKLCAGTKAQVQYLESVRGGKNSIDFQIITELGVLVGRGEADFAYVISQDKGYEAAMGALRARYADTFREVALRPSIQSCLQASFLLRSASREELAQALIREFGPAQGVLAYTHLEELFAPAPVPVPAPAEEPKKASGRRKRGGKGAKTPKESQQRSSLSKSRDVSIWAASLLRSPSRRARRRNSPPRRAAGPIGAAAAGRKRRGNLRNNGKTARRGFPLRAVCCALRLGFIQGSQHGPDGGLYQALRPLVPACQQSGDGLGGRGRLSIEDVVGGSIQQLTEHPETVQTDAGVAGFQISEERYRQLGFLCKDFPCPALVFPRFSEPKAHVNFFRVLFPHTIDAPAYHDEEIVPYHFINQNTI